jgi:protein phosphatase PTC6
VSQTSPPRSSEVSFYTTPPVLSLIFLADQDYSHLLLLSDGLTETLSDQELVDLCRPPENHLNEHSSPQAAWDHWNPQDAAKRIIDFAEEVGASDNMTVLVIRLGGWGKVRLFLEIR